MKAIIILFFTLFSFLTIAQDLTEVQKQQLDVNYLINGGFENGKAGWSTYNDGASASPVDGVGGTANITLTTTTTLPHDGKVSGVLTKDAVNRQGQGIKRDFLIPDIAKGKVVRLKFSYEITSGTYASGDTAVWIYDVTNSRLIQPNAHTIENSGLKESKFVEFQSSIDSNSYRLIVHVTSTSASAYTLKFDSFSVGLTPKIYGSVVTDWVSYTPTFQGYGTPSSVEFQWRRSGGNVEIRGKFIAGTTTAVEARIGLPSGLVSAGTSAIPSIQPVGTMYSTSSTTATIVYIPLIEPSVNYLTYSHDQNTQHSVYTKRLGNDVFSSGLVISVQVSIPIQGWSSSQQLSNDADTRVIATRVFRNASQTIPNNTWTKVTWATTPSFDKNGMWDSANNRLLIKQSGEFNIKASLLYLANATGGRHIAIYKNGVSISENRSGIASGSVGQSVSHSDTLQLIAGDYLEIYTFQSSGGNLDIGSSSSENIWTIERISGPSQIAASETVSARYTQSSGQSIPTSSPTVVDFNTKVYDSHNAVTTGSSWRFTAPISGEYSVVSTILFASSAWPIQRYSVIYLRKNGVNYAATPDVVTQVAQSMYFGPYPLTTKVKLLQGEYIDIVLEQNRGSATSIHNASTNNWVEINRVGNY